MSKILQQAVAEAARLPEAEQDRLGREILAQVERLRASPRPAPQPGRPMTAADLDWLAEMRSKLPRSSVDAGTLVSRMRDEEWR